MRTIRITVFFILLFQSSIMVFGQERQFSSLNTLNGLSQNSVSHIIQDKEGIMWFANQAGIDRFDGRNIDPIKGLKKGLAKKISLLQDFDSERILVGIDHQIYEINKWTYEVNQFLKLPQTPVALFFFENTPFKTILFVDTMILFSSSEPGNSVTIDFSKHLPIEGKKEIRQVLKISEEQYIIGTSNGLFQLEISNTDPILNEIWPNLDVSALHYSPKDSLVYVGLDSMEVCVYDLKASKQSKQSPDPYYLSYEIEHNPVSKINALYLSPKDSTLWVGTKEDGLFLYEVSKDTDGRLEFELIENCHGHCGIHPKIANNTVDCITASEDQVVWLGMEGGGVNYWSRNKQQFSHYFGKNKELNQSGLLIGNYSLGLLAYDDSTLLVGSKEGLFWHDLENNLTLRHLLPAGNASEKSKIVNAIVKINKDSIILGTGGGLFYLDPKILKSEKNDSLYRPLSGTVYDDPVSILSYNGNTEEWWLASRGNNKLKILDGHFQLKKEAIFKPDEFISTIVQLPITSNNSTLVATTKGMYLYSQENENYDSVFISSDSMHVISAAFNRDTSGLWLGTDRKGLFFFDLKTQSIDQTLSITEKDGFGPEVVYEILPDQYNNLWISTNHGIYQISSTKRLFNHYGDEDLLNVGDFNSGSSCISRYDSTFFFGGIDGINSFQPRNIVKSRLNEPAKLITTFDYPGLSEKIVRINSENVDVPILLPSHFNYLEIYFALPSYEDPKNNQFKATLNGSDTTYFAQDGALILPEELFKRSFLLRKNQLVVQYRNGLGDWSEQMVFVIKRRALSLSEGLILAMLGFIVLLLLVTLWLRQHNLTKLAEIQKRINEVSRLETKEELIAQVQTHLIQDFDYVVLSFIDFNNRRIKSEHSEFKGEKVLDPTLWLKESDYSIDDREILAQIARTKETVIVYRNDILNSAIKAEGALNEEISKKYKHDSLGRLFVPIVHRAQKRESHSQETVDQSHQIEDLVLGVIEVGSKLQPWEYLPFIGKIVNKVLPENSRLGILFNPKGYLERKEIQLKLYADNLAQHYYYAFLKENRREFYKEIIDPLEEEKIIYSEFIESVLKQIAEKINADFGSVAFSTYNNNEIDISDDANKFYGKNYTHTSIIEGLKKYKFRNKGKKGIIQHVTNTKLPYYTNDAKNDKWYQQVEEGVKCEAAFPMKDKYEVLYGIIFLSSKKDNFFNRALMDTIKKIVGKVTTSYLQKKESNTLTQLMRPFDIFTRSNLHIYENAVKALKEYYHADDISVWERKPGNDFENEFSLVEEATTYTIKKEFIKKEFACVEIHPDGLKENLGNGFQLVQVKDYQNKDSRISRICQELGIASYLVIPIIIDKRVESFINVFSKREIREDEFSQHSLEFLDSFSKKIAMAIQHAQLINSFTEISKSLSNRHFQNPLQVIVDKAYDLMPSTNSVVLFPYKGTEIILKDRYSAGNIPQTYKESPDKKANFANFVIKHGDLFITSIAKYAEIARNIKSDDSNKITFWETNNLESVAALRLEYNKQAIGVMFFNYEEVKDFEESDATRIIRAFTNLATTALINEDFIRRIQEETINIEKQNTNLTKTKEAIGVEKKRVEKEKLELQQKMDQMLPKAAGTSYFLILQGVNHDIRNFLLGMQFDLIEINEKILGKDNEIINRNLENLNNQTNNITNLLELFDFRDEVNMKVINVSNTIKKVIQFFTNRYKKISFHTNFDENIPDLLCLETEFSMIIYNLINNAIRAINKKGNIRIGSKFEEKQYVLEFEDEGIGIDKEILSQIFDFGYTTKKEGLGIGLYFVKETIKNKMEGSIEVESYKSKGTKFTIRIPEYINHLK